MTAAVCRLCDAELTETFVDLGMSPLCESYVSADRADAAETFYPLHVRICSQCLLVQLPAYVAGEDIFSDYLYFSSYSDSWVAHAKRYADEMTERLRLGDDSLVVEVASNDGYLLQHFVAGGIPVVGVEPAGNVAEVARGKGIRTEVAFLSAASGADVAARYGQADLVAGNNVYAHVPDIRDFSAGLAAAGQADRSGHIGVPASAAPDRTQPVRHHLPRALPVPDAAHLGPRIGHRRPDRGRCGRVEHPRRLAAGARPARRCRRRTQRSGQGRARGRGSRGSAHTGRSRRLRRGGLPGPARPADLPAGGTRRRARPSSATAPRARATRCSTTAASGRT